MSFYSTGTASVNAGETAVTGQGTAFQTAGLRAGDLFTAAGLTEVIASVNSQTSLTLVSGWPGANRAAAAYKVLLRSDADRLTATGLALLSGLQSGSLSALNGLTPAANKLPYFTGAGAAALADLSAFARTLLDDANAAGMRSTLELASAAQQSYEAGTFTPGVSFNNLTDGITYSNQTGRYIRIGKMVYVGATVTLTSKGSAAGQARVTGLPFAAAGGPQAPFSISSFGAQFVSSPGLHGAVAASAILLRQFAGSTFGPISDANFNNTTTFHITGIYEAA